MKLAIEIGRVRPGQLDLMTEWVRHAERCGIAMAFSAEAWWSDSVTPLAYLANQTSQIRLATGIMQMTARTPAMAAMTALTLHDMTGGRFTLGLGASGPQVVEGLHGVPYNRPLTRLRETVEICRQVFAGEKVEYQGKTIRLPLPDSEGKALRIDHEPASIPVYLATLGPNALRYTGEAADGWLGTTFSPEHADAHLAFIREGAAKAGRDLSELDLCVSARVEIGQDIEGMIQRRKPAVAFNMGGMGSAETNFYNAAMQRAGFAEDAKAIQSLWIDRKREEAAARVPDAMVSQFQILGTPEMVKERLKAYRDAGVTTLKLGLDGTPMGQERFALLEQIADMAKDV